MRVVIVASALALTGCSAVVEPNPTTDGDCAVTADWFASYLADDPLQSRAVAPVQRWYAGSLESVGWGRALALRTIINWEPGAYKWVFEECADRAEKNPLYGRLVTGEP